LGINRTTFSMCFDRTKNLYYRGMGECEARKSGIFTTSFTESLAERFREGREATAGKEIKECKSRW